MTIEIEAGASQRQCSTKLWIAHAFSTGGALRRLSTTNAHLSPWSPFRDCDHPLFGPCGRASPARVVQSKVELLVAKVAAQVRTIVRTELPGIRPTSP